MSDVAMTHNVRVELSARPGEPESLQVLGVFSLEGDKVLHDPNQQRLSTLFGRQERDAPSESEIRWAHSMIRSAIHLLSVMTKTVNSAVKINDDAIALSSKREKTEAEKALAEAVPVAVAAVKAATEAVEATLTPALKSGKLETVKTDAAIEVVMKAAVAAEVAEVAAEAVKKFHGVTLDEAVSSTTKEAKGPPETPGPPAVPPQEQRFSTDETSGGAPVGGRRMTPRSMVRLMRRRARSHRRSPNA